MNSAPRHPPPVAASCHTGCAYAEPLRGDYPDWIWCTHPGAAVRVRAIASECPWFPPAATTAPLSGIITGDS